MWLPVREDCTALFHGRRTSGLGSGESAGRIRSGGGGGDGSLVATMAMNVPIVPYEAIGKGFVQQYYALFDDPAQRPNLINMYNTETSFMTFEGLQIQGAIKIMEKLTSLSFQKINRIITAIDSQPMFDGGVLINVLGRLQADEDPPHAFSQCFVLKPMGNSYFCQHDIFRLGIHDSA